MKVYEAGGKVYEALVSLALDELKAQHSWGGRLPNILIDSDFILPDSESPKHVILVTHSTSESGTNIKYWRNIEELFELKSNYRNILVTNIVFGENWKENLLNIFAEVFDGNLIILRKPYYEELTEYLNVIAKNVSKKSNAETKQVINNLLKTEKRFQEAFKHFKSDLDSQILSAFINSDLTELWNLERDREVRNKVKNKVKIENTYVKAGLVKLAFLSEKDRNEVYSFVKKRTALSKTLISFLQSIGLLEVRPKIGGSLFIIDEHIKYVINQIEESLLKKVFKVTENKYGTRYTDYFEIFRDWEKFEDFVCNEMPKLTKLPEPAVKKIILNRIKSDFILTRKQRNHFLSLLISLCKYFDKKFSFDVIIREGNISRAKGLDRFAGIDKLLLGDFLPKDETLIKLVDVLWDRLKQQDWNKSSQIVKDIFQNAFHQTFITIVKHRTINLLRELVLLIFENDGWVVEELSPKFRSCLSEYAGVPNNVADPSFSFILKKNNRKILCHVVAAYEATHKHKEYPGKLRAARYECIKKDKNISFRTLLEDESLLILDGLWIDLFSGEEKVIKAFQSAGWTNITDIISITKKTTA
jgi:hypothetical protein